VSVVIPTYNRVNVIERAVASALMQSTRDLEVIVVDDGSSDGTEELVAGIGDRRVRYLRRDVRGGGSAARNTGLSQARGEFLAFLDSDDEWLPDKLAHQLESVAGPSERKLVMCGFVRLQGCTARQAYPASMGADDPVHQLLALSGGPMSCSLFVVSRVSLDAAGVRFDPRFPALQDLDFALQLASAGFSIVGPREPLVKKFRDPGGSHVYSATSSIEARLLLMAKYQSALRSDRHAHRRQITVLAASLARSGRQADASALLRSYADDHAADWRDRLLQLTAERPRAVCSYEWTVRKASGLRRGMLAPRVHEFGHELRRRLLGQRCDSIGETLAADDRSERSSVS
jgi:glycosyltransferase involved in cell wall biosynthesis